MKKLKKTITVTVDPKKNPGKPPIKDGDTAILLSSDELFVVQKPLVAAIAKVFREKLGKRDEHGREIDLSVASDQEVIVDVVCSIDRVDRTNEEAVATAVHRFWKDPMAFAQRAIKKMAH